ncbi:hypothetical protein BC351_28940 [Paenibacillus ferrarius]|uniref:TniQ domain-containing protein n=1 Tax=Paenibacillus ferrarius TaxID=1469647 RepID=A0A1V4HI21_9BACL|nr:TniQ family protein [Paenibacillus ferrarius]OPH56197.1 hypothetical protein BC351_28940 [Paenibacillus ferrarius]
MFKKYPIKRRIAHDESLLSYLISVADSHGVDILILLEMIKLNEKFRMHSGDLKRVDFYPGSIINLDKLCYVTSLKHYEINNSTFTNVINIFNESAKGESCRVLNNMIRENLFYCPDCLKNSKQLSLLWKIDGINMCFEHRCKLLSTCCQCLEPIKYKNIRVINHCPHCSKKLSDVKTDKDISENELNYQEWLIDNWKYLLNYSGNRLSSSETALRILYVLNEQQNKYSKELVKMNGYQGRLEQLLQCARGTLTKKKAVHISMLLSTLYSQGIHIKDFLKLTLPTEFIDSLHEKSIGHWASTNSCIAPWCLNYGKKGLLIATGSMNSVKRGKALTYYMACPECGCEYALDSEKHLVERTYFIHAFTILEKINISKLTWPEKEKVMGLKRDRIRRVLAYFQSRRTFAYECIDCIPAIDNQLLQLLVDKIQQGTDIQEIRFWQQWINYDQYLLYRFHHKVISILITNPYLQKSGKNSDPCFKKLITATCEEFLKNNININLPSVSLAAGTSSTTIRSKDCSDVVISFRIKQTEHRREKLIQEIEQKVIAYFDKHVGEKIFSQKLYAAINVQYPYLKLHAFWLAEKIEQMRKEHNLQAHDAA